MFTIRKLFVLFIMTALILTACAPTAAPAEPVIVEQTKIVEVEKQVEVTPAPKEPIRVGISSPFTGAVAYGGEDVNMGATLAMEEINAEGGILGHPIELFVADNACSADQAISSIRKLVEVDKVVVINGALCSGATMGAMPLLEQYEVPMVTSSSTNPKITDMSGVGGNIWEFRTSPHDVMMADGFSKVIAEDAETVAILAPNDDYGRGAAAAFEAALANEGVEVLAIEFHEKGQPDYHSILTKWKELDPDALVIPMFAHDASIFMRQFRELQMPQMVFARGAVVTPEFLEDIKDDLTIGDGIMEATGWAYGAGPDFDQRFEERWGFPSRYYAAMAYMAVRYVIADAIRIAIEETGEANPATIRDALEKVSVETFNGLIEFDEYNQAHPLVSVTTLDDQGNISLLAQVPTD